jgi:hypothetical protein
MYNTAQKIAPEGSLAYPQGAMSLSAKTEGDYEAGFEAEQP